MSRPSLRHILTPFLPSNSAPISSFNCRNQSTLTAAQAASALLSRFKGKTRTATQMLDANQLQKLSLTLSRRELYPGLDVSAQPPPVGTVVPPGYHLVYFTPGGIECAEGEVGADGTDTSWNAPAPFTRRMWAGGRMRWDISGQGDGKGERRDEGETVGIGMRESREKGRGEGMQLRVGDEVTEKTRLVSAVPKRSRDGSEMVLVQVEKEFWGPRGLALVDERSWIFRPEATTPSPAASRTLREAVISGPSTVKDIAQEGAYPHRHFRWSPTGLFRFSALTFNGHKIHYDPAWSAAVEGHPGCVVHGPINLICMLDYWRDHCAAVTEGRGGKGVGGVRGIKEIRYRAVAPVYAGESYGISAEKAGDEIKQGVESGVEGEVQGRWELLVKKEGRVCMKGEILGA
ncbi:hypothetical protein GGR55DRAFT_672427 [Xylaria sp. FL0064]|nr:hypothetical protein GGR55DRAFT_672427 [Xylaria sp. FL0064]